MYARPFHLAAVENVPFGVLSTVVPLLSHHIIVIDEQLTGADKK